MRRVRVMRCSVRRSHGRRQVDAHILEGIDNHAYLLLDLVWYVCVHTCAHIYIHPRVRAARPRVVRRTHRPFVPLPPVASGPCVRASACTGSAAVTCRSRVRMACYSRALVRRTNAALQPRAADNAAGATFCSKTSRGCSWRPACSACVRGYSRVLSGTLGYAVLPPARSAAPLLSAPWVCCAALR